MLAGISRYVRQHHIALLALFIALGGTAWAAATINSKDVVDNSLKSVDLKDGKGVKAADVAPGELVAPGSEAWQEVGFFAGGFTASGQITATASTRLPISAILPASSTSGG